MMYKHETKEKAKAIYIKGESFAFIAREIGCNPETVGKWSRDEGWSEERAKVCAEAKAITSHKASILMSEKIIQRMQVYQDMLSKGIEALNRMDIKSAAEAGQLIDKAIKGMESIKPNYLHARFLKNVGEVLKAEIHDRELLSHICEELVRVYETYHYDTN